MILLRSFGVDYQINSSKHLSFGFESRVHIISLAFQLFLFTF